MRTDDDLRAVLCMAAPTPTGPAPDSASLASRVRRLRRRRLLGRGSGVLAVIALLAVGVPSLGAFQRDEDVALRGGAPPPGRAPAVDGPIEIPFRLLEVERPSRRPGTVRQLDSAEMFDLDDRLRGGTPLGEGPLLADEVVLEVVVVASTCVPTLEGLTLDGASVTLRLGELREFAEGAYREGAGCRAVRAAAALRIAVDVHALPSPLEVTVPGLDPSDVPQPVTLALAGPGWGRDPRGWVVPFRSLGRRAGFDLPPGGARQIVGEELLALDDELELEVAGQVDPLQPHDVVLAIAPLRCTPRVAHLRLDGTRLLVHTQEGGCVDGGEGDVGVDTVVLDRASLPERFEVVIDPHEGGPGGSVSSVIELTPDAPPEPAPPRDVPLRGVALLPGERSGLVDGDDLELILVEGATAPEEGEVVLAVSARACDLAVRGAALHGRVLTVTADALPGPAADGAEATCPPLTAFIAVPGALLPQRFTLVAEFRSSSDGADGVQLGEPVDVVLQPLERLRGAALDYLTVELGDGSGMPLASARQIVGEDLVALDARSAASYDGPDDLVTANDVVLELVPPSCTQIGGLSLVGDTLLARVGVGQDGLTGQPCPEGPVPGLDRVVIERAQLPTRFDVVFVGDEPMEGLPTQPVPIVLADDAPPATAPPSNVPFRVLGTGPGEVQVGLAADHAQLQRDGVAPPEPGEVVLGIPVDGCLPSFSSARHFDDKLQISGARDFSNTACPGLTTTTYVAVARGELPPRFVLRAELRDETEPNSWTSTLVGPIAIDLGPP